MYIERGIIMLGFFNKGKKEVIEHVNRSLSRVDKDVYTLQQWIGHLHDRHDDIKNSHLNHIELTRKEISDLQKTVHYLQTHNAELNKFVRDIITNILELKKNSETFAERIENLEKGQLRTLERTIGGQLKDNSPQIMYKEEEKGQIIAQNRPAVKSEMNGSQIEMLNVLYHADRPLSYDEIAKILVKKPKSIRNLIYELREKNIDIKARPIGIRKKGFFISKEEKIRVSGR